MKKTVDAYILTLKFVPDWLVTSNMLEYLDYHLFFNYLDFKYDYGNSGNNSDDNSDDDSGYIESFMLISWFKKYHQCKECKNKIDKEYKQR